MKQAEVNRFNKLYERHLRLLKLQGKAQKTIDAYSRSDRRVRDHFDCCPGKFMYLALIVIMENGGLSPVGTGVARNARTMKPVNGLTGNRQSYCLFIILWRHLHCLMN